MRAGALLKGHSFSRQSVRPGAAAERPAANALAYAHKRLAALEVLLSAPDMPIDTNHLERALLPIPLGRKNWMFSWTKLGAQHVGVVQCAPDSGEC